MGKIEFHNVCKNFPVKGTKLFQKSYLHAVKDVSFSLEEGHTLALVGESGCGKTTIARLLMKLHEATSGRIFVDGEDIGEIRGRSADWKYRQKIQMIFQDPFASLNPAYSVGTILSRAITLHNKGLSRAQVLERMMGLLTLVGLTPPEDFMTKHPAMLSGGQRQRIVIARALAVNPSIIVADEPTSMLDVSIGIDIMNLLLDLKEKQNLTMLYITHNFPSARYMADEMAVIYGGTLVEYGKSDDLIASPCHPYTVLLLNSTPEPFRENHPSIHANEEGADLISGKPQCMFCNRCPMAMDKCFNTEPPEYVFGDRRVKCYLYEGKTELEPVVDVSIYAKGESNAS